MAGSYKHVTAKIDGARQFLGPCLLDHLGDATEALEELWFMAHYLAGDDPKRLDEALERFYRPGDDPLAAELKARLRKAVDNDYWQGNLSEVSEGEA